MKAATMVGDKLVKHSRDSGKLHQKHFQHLDWRKILGNTHKFSSIIMPNLKIVKALRKDRPPLEAVRIILKV